MPGKILDIISVIEFITMNFFTKNRIGFSAIIIAMICFALFLFFPTSNLFQQISVAIAFFLITPILYIRIILKENLRSYGIQFKFDGYNLFLSAIFALVLISLLYVIIKYTGLLSGFSSPQSIAGDFKIFILYEVIAVGVFTFIFEFFFRGFIAIGIGSFAKHWAVLLQFIFLVGLVMATQAQDWTMILYAISAPFSGFMAYKSKSIAYSFAVSYVFILLADTLLIIFTK